MYIEKLTETKMIASESGESATKVITYHMSEQAIEDFMIVTNDYEYRFDEEYFRSYMGFIDENNVMPGALYKTYHIENVFDFVIVFETSAFNV